MHGLGYNLTYFKDIPHGLANAYFLKEYLKFNYSEAKNKIDNCMTILGYDSIEGFSDMIHSMIDRDITITKEELNLYANLTMNQRSVGNNIRQVKVEDVMEIIGRSVDICD
jgi:alcohol dehydrogenase class IV